MRALFLGLLASLSFACGARSGLDGGGDVPPGNPAVDPSTIESARPLAPLSTATTATRTPTLRWILPKSADGAEVELCGDRACTRSLGKIQATGDHVRLASALADRVVYWRLRGMRAGVVGAKTSATWELFTSARDAHDAAWGSVPDFDGDGLADWMLGAFAADDDLGKVEIFRGRNGGVGQVPDVTLHGDASSYFGERLGSIGDLDGDGFPELAVGSQGGVSIYAGGPSGIDATKDPTLFGDAQPNAFGSAGDLDGDGYGDFYVAPQNAPIVIHFGAAKNPGMRTTTIATPIENAFSYATSGDLDGDGRPDLCVGFSTMQNAAAVRVYPGGGAPIDLPTEPSMFLAQVDCRGDVDGDGYADVVVAWVASPTDVIDVFRGGPSGVATAPSQITFPLEMGMEDSVKGSPIAVGDFNGDGRDDLVAGLLGRQLEIVDGSASGLDASTMRTLALPNGVPQELAMILAPSVANGGDLNGDGVVDLVAGAQGYWTGEAPNLQVADVGHAWVYAGTASGIRDSSTPLALLAGPGDDQLSFACDVE